ncbi:alpha/beta fold hydrolase [Xanthomonas theicola]|uniref:AB hydrolase-1 domain-containing protein n=1 Tax=Xanthomonas theicola TaxID=56464 RepID=A0A2S6ZJ01_9XANT|nr:alpha/beta hydrolase [Xanthomonas theicola]PPT92159.1 hypothetical protein XthCFBP4691_05205 [Xanthomonas theicola]
MSFGWSLAAACVLILMGILGVVFLWGYAPDLPLDQVKARWAKPPSYFPTIDGMDIHVRDEGPKSDLPIVLLHGTGSSLLSWDGWADGMKQTRRVIRFDRPGFGLTGPDPTGDYHMDRAAKITLDLLDKLGVHRFILAGNSSGGRVAWHVALRSPDRVAGLILVDAAGYSRTTPLPLALRIAQSEAGSALMQVFMPRAVAVAGLRAVYGDPQRLRPETIAWNLDISRRAGVRRALRQTLLQAPVPDDSSRIREITAPTLILWGDRDTTVTRGEAERFHADIRGSRLAILPGLGHLPHEEDPTATLVPVEEFLRQLPESRV